MNILNKLRNLFKIKETKKKEQYSYIVEIRPMLEKYRLKREIRRFTRLSEIKYWHVTLIYNFRPKEGITSWDLAKIISKVASKYSLKDLWFYYDGFEFNKAKHGYVFAFKIKPSPKLRKLRAELYNHLRPYIVERPDVKAYNDASEDNFWFHATIGYRLSERHYKLLLDLAKTIDEYFLAYPLRITLLRNSRIAYEYDITTNKILSREEALSRRMYSEMVKSYRRIFNLESPATSPATNPSTIWLISDTHFDHENIIKYCARPFADVKEMNTVLLKNWNNTVKDIDTVYFLGDMSFGRGSRDPLYWLQRLKGQVRYVRGNHERIPIGKEYEIIEYKGYKFLLVHDPERVKSFDGWIIHGHVHNNKLRKYPFINAKRRTINVCVEVINYKPISLDEIIKLIQQYERLDIRPYEP